jgi:hypothetical protein
LPSIFELVNGSDLGPVVIAIEVAQGTLLVHSGSSQYRKKTPHEMKFTSGDGNVIIRL